HRSLSRSIRSSPRACSRQLRVSNPKPTLGCKAQRTRYIAEVADREHIKTALTRPARAAAVFIGHLLLGSVVIGGIWLTHWLFLALWGEKDPKFFDWIPIRWVFDA